MTYRFKAEKQRFSLSWLHEKYNIYINSCHKAKRDKVKPLANEYTFIKKTCTKQTKNTKTQNIFIF